MDASLGLGGKKKLVARFLSRYVHKLSDIPVIGQMPWVLTAYIDCASLRRHRGATPCNISAQEKLSPHVRLTRSIAHTEEIMNLEMEQEFTKLKG